MGYLLLLLSATVVSETVVAMQMYMNFSNTFRQINDCCIFA